MRVKRSVIAVALCALSARVFADPATADTLAAEAEAFAKVGKFSEAAERFRDAWRNDKLRPTLLCNVGISYYKAKDLVRAHLLLGQCLEQSALDPKTADGVRKALASVEAVLRSGGNSPVRVLSDPSATSIAILELGNDEAFVGSRVVWLPFGTYHVRAHAEGYIDQIQTIAPKAPDPMTVTITLERVKGEPSPNPSASPSTIAAKPIVAVVPERGRPSRPGIALPIATSVVTAAAVVLAVVARDQAGSKAERAATALDPATFQDDKQTVGTWNATFVLGTSAAVVGAVASVLLWHRALAAPPLEVQATTTRFSLGYTARF